MSATGDIVVVLEVTAGDALFLVNKIPATIPAHAIATDTIPTIISGMRY